MKVRILQTYNQLLINHWSAFRRIINRLTWKSFDCGPLTSCHKKKCSSFQGILFLAIWYFHPDFFKFPKKGGKWIRILRFGDTHKADKQYKIKGIRFPTSPLFSFKKKVYCWTWTTPKFCMAFILHIHKCMQGLLTLQPVYIYIYSL